MKIVYSLSIILSLVLLPTYSNAQVIEGMESELGGGGFGNEGGGGSNLWWLDLVLNVGIDPMFGLFFGFDGEPFPNDIDFSPYPYFDDYSGNYLMFEEEGRPIQGQFTAHFQNNENTLSGGFFQLKFSPARFLTLDINHLRLVENRIDDDQKDYLNITNFNVSYNRVRLSKFSYWWGSGLMLLDGNTLYGSPSFTTGMDIFIRKPLSIHANLQLGAPNNTVTTMSQVKLQAHLDRFVISAGFSGLQIGSVFEGSWLIGSGVYF
jgi:hypothetical protein